MGIALKQLTKVFGEKKAVDKLDLEMPEPGIYGLIGTNGAGKTTTIRMMLGVLRPDGGEVLWNGAAFAPNAPRYGYLPEERGIYAKSKVAVQLRYFAELKGLSKSEAADATKWWLERLRITEYADMQAEKLSKGNQQKVQMITCLLHDPELIVMDEPFSGLDPVNTEQFRELLLELESKGKYIFLSSHQMSTVEEYCKNITLLHRGETLLQGNLKEIKHGYGHTRLIVDAPPDALALASDYGLTLLDRRGDDTTFSIPADNADARCEKYLRTLLEKGILPLKFTLSEPSLHEIFIEKVGAEEAATAESPLRG
ncbi:MAG: ATP-binding cassette domain-containing protein [Oscillospiraceae bacterium]|jgi:ABC-2 type transport system ATP-binding protein|nr:ATP-binding cassette domain-containing protein [Oscillospiraceae bacterium]